MSRQSSFSFKRMKVWRMKNGVILADPVTSPPVCWSSEAMDTGATISDFMQMSISFWLLNTEAVTKVINPEGVDVCGFRSEKYAIGCSLLEVSQKESAIQLMENCRDVIRSNKLRIFEELNIRKDGTQQQFLSIKLPWYDLNQHVIGVCGFSIVLGRHSLANNLSILAGFGIPGGMIKSYPVPTPSWDDHLNRLSLPSRERQCLQFTLQGYTAKMIARELRLSYRTIESYLINLKNRLGVNSKLELIQIARGWFDK